MLKPTGIILLFLLLPLTLSYPGVIPGTDTLTFTLSAAIERALAQSWDVRIGEREVQKAEEQINEAYASAYPRLDFSASYSRNIKLPVLFLPPNTAFNPSSQTQTIELGSKNSFSAGITLGQALFNYKVNTAIKIADDYSRLAATGLKGAKNDVTVNVQRAFYGVLLMKKLLAASREGMDVAEATLKNIRAMRREGVASEYDELRAEVQVANLKPGLLQLQNNLESALNFFKLLLVVDINTPVDITGEFTYNPVPDAELIDQQNTAVANSTVLAQLSLQQAMYEKKIIIETSDYYPTLSGFGQYAWQTQDNTFTFSNYLWAKTLMVGLQLSYTLFDGFSRGARIQQAKIDRDIVGLNIGKATAGIRAQVVQAYNKILEARKKIEAQQKSVEQAEKALRIAQTRFKSGIGTQLELIDTQAALSFAKTNYAQALYDHVIARAEWEYILNTSVSESN